MNLQNKSVFFLVIFLSLLLLSGCINISIDQKLDRNGDSIISETMDMSSIITLLQSYQKQLTQPIQTYTKNINPDNTFNGSNYANLPEASSKGLLVDVEGLDDFKSNTEFSATTLDILNTNNYTIKKVTIEIKSKAFIAKNVRALSNIATDQSIKHYVSFSTANISAGPYPVIFLISFLDNNNTNQTVVYKTSFNVEAQRDTVSETNNVLANLSASMNDICKNATRDDPVLTCSYSDGIFKLSKEITSKEAGYEFKKESRFPYIVYILKLNSMPQITNKTPSLPTSPLGTGGSAGPFGDIGNLNKPMKFTDALSKPAAAYMKLSNLKFTYTLEMPGEITSVKNGKIENGKAVYDVVELMDKGLVIEVESQELDTSMFIIVGIGALVLIVGVLFLISRRHSEPAK